MMRPFTLVCMASAFGAGLYLYQSKHAAQMLDREITRTLKQTDLARDRTVKLRSDWAQLNEPDRLAELARAHLQLQTLKPTQFATLADLGSRLPAPVAAQPEALPEAVVASGAEADEAVPVAQAPAPAAAAKLREVAEVKPRPEPKPEPRPAAEKAPAEKVVAESRPVRPAPRPEPVVATTAPARPHVYAPPPVVANAEAVAPGTVGAAVLRAMRAQGNNYAQGSAHVAAPTPAYVQPASNGSAYTPSYAGPAYGNPTYARPAYASPTYAAPAYAGPAASVLGGRPALPPPVPFAAR